MRRLTENELAGYDTDKESDTWDMLAWIFIVLIVGVAMGYAWRYIQEPSAYERGYTQGMDELSVVARGEICRGGIIGQDCFNPEECEYITIQELAQQRQHQPDLAGIREVYEKYKHLDKVLSDPYLDVDDDFPGHIRRELWLAIREIYREDP